MDCSCTINCEIDCGDDISENILIHNGGYQSPREVQCDECKGWIEPNEEHNVIIWDSIHGLTKYRSCLDCEEIKEVFYDDYYFKAIWGILEQNILDGEIEITEYCLTRLNKKNRDKVCAFVEKLWKTLEIEEEHVDVRQTDSPNNSGEF